MSVLTDRVNGWAQRQAEIYRSNTDEGRPLGGYLGALGVYAAGVGATTLAARAVDATPPERITPFDLILVGMATHKTSRIIAKDAVTSPLRAPFTIYDQPSGEAELAEHPRKDDHVRHAVGELLMCPFCLAQWVATGFAAGLVFAPRFTRLAAMVMASTATSDFLQLGYAALQQVAE
jgi:hypothetical protein